jgi:DNA-binding NarL/FixJ family response regulator
MCVRTPNRVLLADRHQRLSEGVRGLLEMVFNGVFVVADKTSLLEGAARLLPELIVVDLSLAQGDLGDLLASLRVRAPEAKILLLSVHDELAVAADAIAAGADGLVLKRAIATDLLPAVSALADGEHYVSPRVGQ